MAIPPPRSCKRTPAPHSAAWGSTNTSPPRARTDFLRWWNASAFWRRATSSRFLRHSIMHDHPPVTLLRDVAAAVVPVGTKVTLLKGEQAYITQSLGGSYTVIVNGNM